MKTLLIDNYDSFVYNLVQQVGEFGSEPQVYRNNKITLKEINKLNPDNIIISPGPGTPSEKKYFGICSDIIRNLSPILPILGVCLGHQGIIHGYGGNIIKAGRLMHGKVSLIKHDGEGIFEGLNNPFVATRYHSLVGERSTIPKELKISANSEDDNEVMAVKHVKYPVNGIQFHPESILTKEGGKLIRNFLKMSRR
ncbi:anthranilate synthase component II [Thermoproteota archaeon]